MYPVIRNTTYDFLGQSYANSYPNLHKYPATMIPQIGIEILTELGINQGVLLDPYCGSGSSFTAGLDRGLKEMWGFDINPLAILISRAKFTRIDLVKAKLLKQQLRNEIYDFVKVENNLQLIEIPTHRNINFWFSSVVLKNLSTLKHFIKKLDDTDIQRLFLVSLSETIRECSYTRNHEFKLYKMKAEDILRFNPDVFSLFFDKLNKVIDIYKNYYYPKLTNTQIVIEQASCPRLTNCVDIVLTSPPYGDSKTTVAYGQFSQFANEWFEMPNARQIDRLSMGGLSVKATYRTGIIKEYIDKIAQQSMKRALEVSSFYVDLAQSIKYVVKSMKKGAKSVYIVGNRCVKDIQLPTDQFIAEQFVANGCQHLLTYSRLLSNKVMPAQNSPSNQLAAKRHTMSQEYIVVCEK